MPFCTACGAKNTDEARFCSACGAAMPTAVSVAPAVSVARIKPFDNPDELWTIFFYVAIFNLIMYMIIIIN